jgi:hypothetical protein
MDENQTKFEDVEIITGRTQTWACEFMKYSYVFCFFYSTYNLIVPTFGGTFWALATLLSAPVFYNMPVIFPIEPLSTKELKKFKKYKKKQK